MESGQLSDVDFTIREMTQITESFMDVFRATYHSREVKDIKEIEREVLLKKAQGELDNNEPQGRMGQETYMPVFEPGKADEKIEALPVLPDQPAAPANESERKG